MQMNIFEPDYFKEYRKESLVKTYEDFFKKISSLNNKIYYGYRNIDDYQNNFDDTNKSIIEKIIDVQNSFIRDIQKKSQTGKYVFISHKHHDLNNVLDLVCFLQDVYHIGAYVDSLDRSQPLITSVETAVRIKDVIRDSHRFIFLATDGAIRSKWCNWELGYGDSVKHSRNHLAFWALQETSIKQGDFKGNEYMEMYPFIVRGGGECDSLGYSVRIKDKWNEKYIPLKEWLA